MHTLLSLLPTRAALLLGLAGLALSQTGCAHPVVMEPSVVIQARVGGPVYGSVTYGPPTVVLAPAPVWLPPPPPAVFMAPPMWPPYPPPQYPYRPGWRGEHHRHGWGHRGW